MVMKSILLAAAFTTVLAAPQYNSYSSGEWDSGFPVCQKQVYKPSCDGKGRGYGWEYGKSCIIPAKYDTGCSKSYGYEAPKYSYEQPKYEQPRYEQPRYEAPKYDSGYKKQYFAAPAAPSYQQPAAYEVPSYQQQPTYQQQPAYQTPTYQQPAYQTPTYQPTYQTPTYQQPKYEQPKYEQPKYEAPKYEQPKYEAPKYSTKITCDSWYSVDYILSSPTLKQCYKIACEPSQSKEYRDRALYQCAALEEQARLTSGGKLPYGW